MYLCVFSLTNTTNQDKPTPPYISRQQINGCYILVIASYWQMVVKWIEGITCQYCFYFFIEFCPFFATLWLTELRLASQFLFILYLSVSVCLPPFAHLWVVNVHVGVTAWRDYSVHFLWSVCVLHCFSSNCFNMSYSFSGTKVNIQTDNEFGSLWHVLLSATRFFFHSGLN